MSDAERKELAELLAKREALQHQLEGLHTELAMIEWRMSELRGPLNFPSKRRAFWETRDNLRRNFAIRESFFDWLNRGKR